MLELALTIIQAEHAGFRNLGADGAGKKAQTQGMGQRGRKVFTDDLKVQRDTGRFHVEPPVQAIFSKLVEKSFHLAALQKFRIVFC